MTSIGRTSESATSVDDAIEVDDSQAISCFGTEEYWDDLNSGFGEFPAARYSWYFYWNEIKRHVSPFLPSKDVFIFLPGIGNDPLLVDLVAARYKKLSAQDYYSSTIERQRDLLKYVDGKDAVAIDMSVSYDSQEGVIP